MKEIKVCASREYNVHIGRGLLSQAGSFISEALDGSTTSGGSMDGRAADSSSVCGAPDSSLGCGAPGSSLDGGVPDSSSGCGAPDSSLGCGAPGSSLDGGVPDSSSGCGAPSVSTVSGKKICIVTDSCVNELYGNREQPLWRSLENEGFRVFKYVFPGGEESKNMTTVTGILEFLTKRNFGRKDLLLALGGGITGDITGFAAAIYLRGIDFVQAPTSLLAAVDSSVGGKTGVNLPAGKNLAGAFWQPLLVLYDGDTLDTLDNSLKLDGVAEAVKAGIIADAGMIDMVQEGSIADHDFLMELAARAVLVKRDIVEADERESGQRQLLNLGHTVAHAIEKCSDYKISHGHAVAMGTAIVTSAAHNLGWCDDECRSAILGALNKFDFPLQCSYSADELAQAAQVDKKVKGDSITLVVPVAVGNCALRTVPTKDIAEFISSGLEV